MTETAGQTAELTSARRALPGLGRLLAATSAVLLMLSVLAAPAGAETLPSPEDPTAPAQPVAPSPSSAPSSSAPSGNAPPEFIQCPGIIVQAGVPESFGFQVTDPDGDQVTLAATPSSIGAEATIEGHTLTYTAPPEYTGQDYIAVTAEDGNGGVVVCDLSIRVEERPEPTPTPTSPEPSPTDSPSASPTQDPPTPAPSPTSTTPAPSQGPTSAPAPTTEPSPAPTNGTPGGSPGGPSGGSSPSSAPSGGGSAPGSPGTGGGQDDGSSEGSGGGQSGNGTGSGDGGPTEDGAEPSDDAPDTPATLSERLRDLTRETTVTCSLQAVEDARTLVEGISAGAASRPGGGNFPDGSPEGGGQASSPSDQAVAPEAAGDRTSVTGSSIWLFAGMGVLMVVLIGLAAAALPRGSRRH